MSSTLNFSIKKHCQWNFLTEKSSTMEISQTVFFLQNSSHKFSWTNNVSYKKSKLNSLN